MRPARPARAALALALALAAGAPAGAARAAATDGEDLVGAARSYFDAGRQAFRAGKFAAAASAFEEALRLAPRPGVVFSLAQAHRRQFFVDHDATRLRRAIELYRKYLALVPEGGRREHAVRHLASIEPLAASTGAATGSSAPKPAPTQVLVVSHAPGAAARVDGAEVGPVPAVLEAAPGRHRVRVEAPGFFPEEAEGLAVEGRLVVVDVALRERPARVEVLAPDGARIFIDGRAAGTAPLAAPLEVPPGHHLVAAAEKGSHPWGRELDLTRDQSLRLEARLDTTAQRLASRWLLGIAGALLVSSGATGGLAKLAEDGAREIDDRRAAGANLTQAEAVEHNDLLARRDDLVTTTIALAAGAVALAIAGGVLYVADAAHEDLPEPAPVPDAAPAPPVAAARSPPSGRRVRLHRRKPARHGRDDRGAGRRPPAGKGPPRAPAPSPVLTCPLHGREHA